MLTNPFFQALSSSFAGTQVYMAMEKLGQLSRAAAADGTWDLIVVDTPPSRSAPDFLDAPERLGSFLDGRFIRIIGGGAQGAGRGIGKVIGAGLGLASGAMKKCWATSCSPTCRPFVQALDSIFGGFRARAEETYRILQEPGQRSWWSPRRNPTRCARRRTSSTG